MSPPHQKVVQELACNLSLTTGSEGNAYRQVINFKEGRQLPLFSWMCQDAVFWWLLMVTLNPGGNAKAVRSHRGSLSLIVTVEGLNHPPLKMA